MPDSFSKLVILIISTLLIFTGSCRNQNEINPELSKEMPAKILWVWERPADLSFLETDKFGVAFLAQRLFLQNDDVIYKPRRQKLEVSSGTYLVAVTRIETVKDHKNRPSLSAAQKEKIVSLVKKTLQLPHVRAVQIDFDVVVSEREFYRNVLTDLRTSLPENVPLTITSLASWCVGDSWFNDLPIDEAVPMAFRMGADDGRIRSFLANGNDWREPLCRGSYGISTDEPLKMKFKPNRRFYYFNAGAWKKSDLENL